jgi:hypothetical protein
MGVKEIKALNEPRPICVVNSPHTVNFLPIVNQLSNDTLPFPLCPDFTGETINETICFGSTIPVSVCVSGNWFLIDNHESRESYSAHINGFFDTVINQTRIRTTENLVVNGSALTDEDCQELCLDVNITDTNQTIYCGFGNIDYCSYLGYNLSTCVKLYNATSGPCWGDLVLEYTEINFNIGSNEMWCQTVDFNSSYCGYFAGNITTELNTYGLSWAIMGFSMSNLSLSSAFSAPVSVFIEFNGKEIIYSSDDSMNGFTSLIRKSNYAEAFDLGGFRFTHRLPRDAFAKSGTITVTVYETSGLIVAQKEFEVVGITVCELFDCVWCPQSFNNFSCQPPAIKAGVIMFFILISCLILCLTMPCWGNIKTILGGLAWMIKTIFITIFCFPMTEWGGRVWGAISKGASYIGKGLTIRTNSLPVTSVMLCLLICTDEAYGCDKGVTIPVSSSLCSNNKGIETCSITFTSVITIPFVTGVACMTFQDPQSLDVKMEVDVTYLADSAQYTLNHLYYTSAYEVHMKSLSHCFGSKRCSHKILSKIIAGDRTLGEKLKTHLVVDRPGDSVASLRSNPSECILPFNNGETCVYAGWGINPVGPLFLVSLPGALTQQPIVQVDFHVDNQTITKFIRFNNGISIVNGLSVSLVGTLSAPQIDFADFKLISDVGSGGTFLSVAADRGLTVGNTYGAIQGNSTNSLLNPTKNSFSFNSAIIGVETDGVDYTSWSYTKFAETTRVNFPTTVDGNVWKFNTVSGLLETNVTKGSALVLSIDSGTGYKISRKVNIVCPQADIFQEGSGCFDCSLGSKVQVRIFSTCSAGMVAVTADESYVTIHTNSIRITTEPQVFDIDFQTSQADNHFKLIFHGDSTEISVEVDFQAIENIDIVGTVTVDSNQTQISEGGKSDGFSLGDFSSGARKWFDGIFKWTGSLWSKIVFIVVITIILVAVGIGTILTLQIIKAAFSIRSSTKKMV